MQPPTPETHEEADGQVGTYLAECFWPGLTEAKLVTAAAHAWRSRAARCLEVILIPADEIVLCLCQARGPTAVADATRQAGLPAERIIESIRIRPAPA